MNINDIKPYEKNAKKHPAKQIKQVAASIKEFGFNQPIVVDKNNIIIVGHGRYEAAKLLGLQEVPVLSVNLSEEQAKAYRLADNKLNESEWDMNLAIEDLGELSEELFNLTGFDIDLLLGYDDNDDIVPANAPAIAKLGDIWALGKHRVMCGDSTKKADVEALMNGIQADMVFTDPPYNVNYKGSGKNTSTGILNDKMSEDNFSIFLKEAFQRMAENSKEGAGWYVFHSSTTQDQFKYAIEQTPWKVKTQLIWNKPTAGMGMGDYRGKHEPFFYCGYKETVFYGDRTGTTVWDFQKEDKQLLSWAKKQKKYEQEGKTTIWTIKREPVQDYVHPTQKPVELITHALRNSSKPGDVVMDTFLGSGSTLIACEKSGRICYGLELDPKYVDTIIKRWEDYTNQKAVKLE